MAKSFRFPRWVEKTRTYSIHPVAFIDQPVATPHQPRYAQQLPPGGSQGGFAAAGRQVGDPYMASAILQPSQILKRTVGVANLATRSFRNNGGRCMESATATSSWLPPGGSQELRSLWSLPFNELLSCVGFGSPSWRPLQGAGETMSLQQPTQHIP